jgi:hypothetical protein
MSIRQSQWAFNTSKSIELGIGDFGLGDGTFYLTSPGGQPVSFRYRIAGIGVSLGIPLSVTVSTKNTLSAGQIYMLNSFRGPELKSTDMTGFCQVIEGSSIVVAAGENLTVMLLGMSLKSMVGGFVVKNIKTMLWGGLYQPVSALMNLRDLLSGDAPVAPDPRSAKAMLVMAGDSFGGGYSAGAMSSVGYVSTHLRT